MRKQIFTFLFVIVLAMINVLPVLGDDISPPEFTATLELGGQGYRLMGSVNYLPDNATRVYPLYSLDDVTYQTVDDCDMENCDAYDWNLDALGTQDEDEKRLLYNQLCATPKNGFLKRYLDGHIDQFYIKLQITLEEGITYDTKAHKIERTVQPVPGGAMISVGFAPTMRGIDQSQRPIFMYGKYQMTVKETALTEEIYGMLPSTVPVEIQFTLPQDRKIHSGIVPVSVQWKRFSVPVLAEGETTIVYGAANPVIIPEGTQIKTAVGTYELSKDLGFTDPTSKDEIRLWLNVIGHEEKPEVSLRGSQYGENTIDFANLSLAFTNKPSGATSIKAYTFQEGQEDWEERFDLLSSRMVDANQAESLYGYIDLLNPSDELYQQYLEGEISGFSIGLVIKGGVYDGEQVILSCPGEYNPPVRIPYIIGSGGNENNAGNSKGDNSNSEGQRSNLSDKEVSVNPSVTSKPQGRKAATSSRQTTDLPQFTDVVNEEYKTQPPKQSTEKSEKEQKRAPSEKEKVPAMIIVLLFIVGAAGIIVIARKSR